MSLPSPLRSSALRSAALLTLAPALAAATTSAPASAVAPASASVIAPASASAFAAALAPELASALVPAEASADGIDAGVASPPGSPPAPAGGAGAPPAASWIWADWSGDGRLDALGATAARRALLLEQTSEGQFIDRTDGAGLAGLAWIDADFGDVDLDGRVDLVALDPGGELRLYLQGARGTFLPSDVDVVRTAAVQSSRASSEDASGAAGRDAREAWERVRVVEVHGDGRPDLHLSRGPQHRLLAGRGDGTFEAIRLASEEPAPAPAGSASASLAPSSPAPSPAEASADPGVATSPLAPAGGVLVCAGSVTDQASTACIQASSVPSLGLLYPLSSHLFVSVVGFVGIGTLAPGARLDVAGTARATQIVSTVATGTPPLLVSSRTLVPLLNADQVDGFEASEFRLNAVAITSSDILDGTVGANDLANGSVTSLKVQDGTIGNVDLANGAVNSAKIQDATVTAVDLAPGAVGIGALAQDSVGSGNIIDGSVASADLADNSVGTAKIQVGAITDSRLASNSVNSAKIQDASVTAVDLAPGAVGIGALAQDSVGSGNIIDGSVLAADIAAGAVGSAQIQNASITSADLADGSINAPALAPGAVNASAIAPGAVGGAALAASSVSSAHVVNGTLQSADFATGAVTSATIADGTVRDADVAGSAAIHGTKIQPSFGNQTVTSTAGATFGDPVSERVELAGFGAPIRAFSASVAGEISGTWLVATDRPGGAASEARHANGGVAALVQSDDPANSSTTPALHVMAHGNGAARGALIECTGLANTGSAFQVVHHGAGPGLDVSSGALPLKLDRTINAGNILEARNGNDVEFRVDSSGDVFCDGAFVGGGADYAEWLPREDAGERLEPGDVVGVHGGKVARAGALADRYMVVSTNPAVIGNHPGAESARPDDCEAIAFVGQVPVKVRGACRRGDLLVPSGRGDGTAVAVAPEALNSSLLPRLIGTAFGEADGAGGEEPTLVVALVGLGHERAVAAVVAGLEAELRARDAALAALARRVEALERR